MSVTTDPPRAFDPSVVPAPAPRTPGWDMGPERRIDDGRPLATGLAWFSIGLGLYEILGAEHLCETLGMEDRVGLVRAFGFREIASGVGIMMEEKPTASVMSRIAGDLADLATLGSALGPDNPHRGRVLGAIGAVAGVTALDILCHKQLTTEHSGPSSR